MYFNLVNCGRYLFLKFIYLILTDLHSFKSKGILNNLKSNLSQILYKEMFQFWLLHHPEYLYINSVSFYIYMRPYIASFYLYMRPIS